MMIPSFRNFPVTGCLPRRSAISRKLVASEPVTEGFSLRSICKGKPFSGCPLRTRRSVSVAATIPSALADVGGAFTRNGLSLTELRKAVRAWSV